MRWGPRVFETREDFEAALAHLPAPDEAARKTAALRQSQLTKPPGSLGRLEDLAVFLSGWGAQPKAAASVAADSICVLVFAGNHGVVERGVSPYPADVTAQMVANFEAGGAAINALTLAANLTLAVHPIALAAPTRDFTQAAAMDDREVLVALNVGAAAAQNVIAAGADVVCVGEMGIGNTTVAAALAARTFGGVGRDWVGPGTGHSREGIALKANIVDAALAYHSGTPVTAFDTLRCVGGRELAAIAGAVLTARQQRCPVLIDGYVATAAIAPMVKQNVRIRDHCIAAHLSAEPAHEKLLACVGLQPLLDLDMRLGEGSGAAVAAMLLRAAAAVHTNMATFAEAAVSNRT